MNPEPKGQNLPGSLFVHKRLLEEINYRYRYFYEGFQVDFFAGKYISGEKSIFMRIKKAGLFEDRLINIIS